jgi:large subunit ribosomal protein L13
MNTSKTYVPKRAEIERNWLVVDAAGRTLGRLASDIAIALRGKHKPTYTPNADVGDFVIVVNAERFRVSGRKMDDKKYVRHSGYPGGLKVQTLRELTQRHPTRVIERAVRGMLPKNALGDALLKKLKVYAGPDHPHAGQQPAPLDSAVRRYVKPEATD